MKDTKNQIMRAAIDVVSKKGYHPATMDEIAKEAGVAKGTLYYYFESKETIFNHMIDSGVEMIREEIMEEIKASQSPQAQLRIVTRVIMSLIFSKRNLFKVILSQLWGEDSRQVVLRSKMNDIMSFIETFIAKCVQTDIEDNDTRLLAFNYFGLMLATAAYYLTQEPICEAVTEDMIDCIIAQVLA